MKKDKDSGSIGLWEAGAMAVGTMIGASIFPIFGIGEELAENDLPIAFLLSGAYAVIVAYSYAKLAPGSNPKIGEAIKIHAKTVVKFHVAKACKDAVAPKK